MEVGLVAVWLFVYLALLYAGASIGGLIFPRFADRGAALGVPLALAVLWLVTYFVGRLSLSVGVWLGVATLVGLAAYAGSRGSTVPRDRYVEAAAVFSVAFLFLVAIRAVDPAIRPIGGEKFLDFGLLKSLLRAHALPPEDMWFANEPVAYYYGGHLVAAILTRITGTAGRFAYNLALAGFYASLVTAAYGLAGNVAFERGVSRRLAGGFAAFFVGVASNLSTPGKVVLWLLPRDLASSVAGALGIPMEDVGTGPADFHYWDASRLIDDMAADFGTYEPSAAPVINEFPFFSWLNGDMHAHMMSTAFLLLAAGVLYSYYQTPAEELRRRRALLFLALPPVAGLVAVANTWSFPTVGGLTVLTVALAPADPRSLVPRLDARFAARSPSVDEAARLVVAVGAGVAVLAVGFLWSLPFWFGPASGREVAILPDRASLGELLLVHGTFVAVFVPYLYSRVREATDRHAARIAGLVAFAVAALAATVDLAALGLFGPLILGGWLLARGPPRLDWLGGTPASADGGAQSSAAGRRTAVGYETILLIAGAGLVTLVEFVFVKENIGRMNTVFKTYMQVWVLWAVAGGVALAYLVDYWPSLDGGEWRSTAANLFAAVLLVSTALYAGFALSDHYGSQSIYARTDDPTLDGRAWLNVSHTDEGDAIRWLDANVEGRPTIVTAAPGGYNWEPDEGKGSSAPASMTGIPTVLGWYHEEQYRNETVYRTRLGHVESIYTGDGATQVALLREYEVEYVYVGPAERARYDQVTIGNVTGITEHKRFGEVVIYRVDQNRLPQ